MICPRELLGITESDKSYSSNLEVYLKQCATTVILICAPAVIQLLLHFIKLSEKKKRNRGKQIEETLTGKVIQLLFGLVESYIHVYVINLIVS